MAAPSTPQRNPFRRITVFAQETMDELRKATWPDWLELRDSTVLVIVTVLILGSMVAVADFSFLNLVRLLSHAASGK